MRDSPWTGAVAAGRGQGGAPVAGGTGLRGGHEEVWGASGDVLTRAIVRIAAVLEVGAPGSLLDCVALCLEVLATADAEDGRFPCGGDVSGWTDPGACLVDFAVHDQTSPPEEPRDTP